MIANVRRWLAVACVLFGCARTNGQTITINFRGMRNLDNTSIDQNGKELPIGGLSGITWRGDDEFLAIQDNGGRIIRLAITFHADDASIDSIKCLGAIQLADARDFEGIAMVPGQRDRVFISEEDTPAVHEFDLTSGKLVRTLATPGACRGRNLRSNFGFESLAARDRTIWTANEEALKCDGAISDEKAGSAVRLLRYSIDEKQISPGQQYVYLTDPLHDAPSSKGRALSRSGVSDLMLLPDGRLLALERSFVMHDMPLPDFRNAIYEADFNGATDVSGSGFENGLIGKRFNPVTKRLLWSRRGGEIGNLEGIALGPQLGPNRWAAVGVIENNNMKLLTNRAAAFEIRIDGKP